MFQQEIVVSPKVQFFCPSPSADGQKESLPMGKKK
jgi:hypothetical protein